MGRCLRIQVNCYQARLETLRLASLYIKQGQVIAAPTDTIYGLLADASRETALRSLFRLKTRPETKPGLRRHQVRWFTLPPTDDTDIKQVCQVRSLVLLLDRQAGPVLSHQSWMFLMLAHGGCEQGNCFTQFVSIKNSS